MLGLAEALRRAGATAAVIAPLDGPAPEPGVFSAGRSVAVPANGSRAPIAPHPVALTRTLSALRRWRPAVVHVHEPFVPGPALAALLVAAPPLVGTFHASGRLPTYRTLRPVLRSLARRLAVRVAVSGEALRAARTPLGGEWEVIPNGIDVASHSAAVPWPTESPAILFVGRHEERKGLSVLLEAFSGLRRRAVLWVAGEGPQTSRLRSGSPEGVEWLGRVDDRELRMRMRGASAVCVPSLRGESFGVILLQAMAAGAPVVASDLAGYREVARPGREALLVPPGDPIALRSALQRVLDGRSLSTSLSRAGAQRAEGFSIDRIAASYLELYEATMRNAGPASPS